MTFLERTSRRDKIRLSIFGGRRGFPESADTRNMNNDGRNSLKEKLGLQMKRRLSLSHVLHLARGVRVLCARSCTKGTFETCPDKYELE